ncbi:hypothetical protein ACH4E8_16205 [Streptomyces sp. NPDC017979]|uniref:hypothetical protein n=1 Tax=Streptomyces sp. NPDC017979 TaxID=3365024 RepID=UPI0037B7A974
MRESLIAAVQAGAGMTVAALTVVALLLLGVAALRLSTAGRTDPSDEARSLTLALYGCGAAVVSLSLFVTVI